MHPQATQRLVEAMQIDNKQRTLIGIVARPNDGSECEKDRI
jgi:hypothetical protein